MSQSDKPFFVGYLPVPKALATLVSYSEILSLCQGFTG